MGGAGGSGTLRPRECAWWLRLEVDHMLKWVFFYVASLPFMSPKIKSRIVINTFFFLFLSCKFLEPIRTTDGLVLFTEVAMPRALPGDMATSKAGPGHYEQPHHGAIDLKSSKVWGQQGRPTPTTASACLLQGGLFQNPGGEGNID